MTRTGTRFELIRRQYGGVSLVLLAGISRPAQAAAVVALLDSGLAFAIDHCLAHAATGDDRRDHAL